MTVHRFIAQHPLRSILLILIFLGSLAAPAISAEETHEEFNIKDGTVKKENIFNMFFGPVPSMPTQRGTVIIEAFHDKNGNQRRDAGEETLNRALSCIVDEVEYMIPAFIPGLDNGKNYTILFEGGQFQPLFAKKEIFIKKRGQIIRIDLPCRDGNSQVSLAP